MRSTRQPCCTWHHNVTLQAMMDARGFGVRACYIAPDSEAQDSALSWRDHAPWHAPHRGEGVYEQQSCEAKTRQARKKKGTPSPRRAHVIRLPPGIDMWKLQSKWRSLSFASGSWRAFQRSPGRAMPAARRNTCWMLTTAGLTLKACNGMPS